MKSDGAPGWQTLRKGWRNLIDSDAGCELAGAIGAKK